MSRPNPAILFGFLSAILLVMAMGALAKGGLYIAKHEGDTLHLLDIVFRMADGEWPHLDFVTPIGVLAFAPIAAFIKLGFGAGHAMIYAQVCVALALLPAIWWTCQSRLNGYLAYFVGLYMVALALALTYGEVEASVSMSMHYNRWAWVLTYIAVLLAVVAPRNKGTQALDGVIIGLTMACLALCKVTYFACFAPPILLALGMRGAFRSIVWALLTGLLVAGAVTFLAGVPFWSAYFGDMLEVASSPIRPQPGQELGNLLGSPAFLGVNLALLSGVVLLRQGLQTHAGLLLLLLAPGFVYVTYQNFGNDPQWLILVFALLLTYRPSAELRNVFGWPLRQAVLIVAGGVFAFALPSFFNLIYSPYRHFGLDAAKYVPLLPRATLHSDLKTLNIRANRVDGRIALDGEGSGLEKFRPLAERENLTVFQGETFPICEVELGVSAWYDAISADLQSAGYGEGRKIYEADLFEAIWLYGPFTRLKQGAPWYYGGTPGYADADFVLVPLCPMAQNARFQKLKAIEELGDKLTEVRRTSMYVLYSKPAG
jgi:hypothetical protein